MEEPRIQPKSEWQKDDCLFCTNEATHEAVYLNAHIRCCLEHQTDAKKMAKDLGE
jgi:hypothetical protein